MNLYFQRLGELATIVLPDVSIQVMTLILHLCYNGQVVFPPDLEDEIYKSMEVLMIGALADFSLKKVKVSETLPPSSHSEEIIQPSTSSHSNEIQPLISNAVGQGGLLL